MYPWSSPPLICAPMDISVTTSFVCPHSAAMSSSFLPVVLTCGMDVQAVPDVKERKELACSWSVVKRYLRPCLPTSPGGGRALVGII